MTISERDWNNYIQRLAKLDKRAGDAMEQYIAKYGTEDTEGLIVYANALVTKYGEGSAELAAQMYDEMAQAAGANVSPAEPAQPPSMTEVAKAVYSTLSSPPSMKGAVSRMVKQAGADTTLKNALRDGAEFAWVPGGTGCAFCLTLASRGWQKASKKAIKGGHAQHIHANCKCNYAIRFDSRTNVAGYDPDKYLQMYENAEGDSPDEKINAMRRAQYQEKKDEINEQKREAYRARKALEEEGTKTIALRAVRGDVTTECIKAAKPGTGKITFDVGYAETKHREEIKTAQWLHDNIGGDIALLNESYTDGEKRADYLWNGAYWDLKTSSSEKSANSAIRKGLKQIREKPGGIILDFGDNDFDSDTLWNVIDKRMQWNHVDGDVDIMVLSKGQLVEVRRYNKK